MKEFESSKNIEDFKSLPYPVIVEYYKNEEIAREIARNDFISYVSKNGWCKRDLSKTNIVS